MKLNAFSSIIWETVEKNMPMEKAFKAFKILTRKSDEEVEARIQNILDNFCEKGYMITEE